MIYCRQGLSRVYFDPSTGQGLSRVYFDPSTGEVIDAIDPGSRQFRWWHLALHRLDLHGLSARPLWDLVMLPLLTGTALVCALGAWMGWRRLRGVRPAVPGCYPTKMRFGTLADPENSGRLEIGLAPYD